MKNRFSLIAVLALICALASGIVYAKPPDGSTYSVNVSSSFGTFFNDCFIFTNGPFLIVGGLPDPQVFNQKTNGESNRHWQSLALPGIFGIAFSGTVTGNSEFGSIRVDGINEDGDTFIGKGEISNCAAPVAPAADGHNNWRQ
jgi:hypothetical protein